LVEKQKPLTEAVQQMR